MLTLRIEITKNLVQVIPLDRPLVFGRGKEADVVLLDQLVSRRHAQFSPADGRGILEDLQSANGTFVNKIRIHSQLLEEGDEVEIGKTRIVYSTEEVGEPLRRIDLLSGDTLESLEENAILEECDLEILVHTDEDLVKRLVSLASSRLSRTPIPPEEILHVEVALQEALGNAVRHGNKYRRDLPIRFRWTIHEDRAVFRVEDKGKGFDYRAAIQRGLELDAASAARKRKREGGMGGLGILMILRFVDRLEYNRLGNELTLTKEFASRTGAGETSAERVEELRRSVTASRGAESPSLDDTSLGPRQLPHQ